MAPKRNPHNRHRLATDAQTYATKWLVHKYREEYRAQYRAYVLNRGGRVIEQKRKPSLLITVNELELLQEKEGK